MDDNTFQRDSFTMTRSIANVIRRKELRMALELFGIVCDYALDGIEPTNLDDDIAEAWELLQSSLKIQRIRSLANSQRKVKSGGAPQGNSNARKPDSNPDEAESRANQPHQSARSKQEQPAKPLQEQPASETEKAIQPQPQPAKTTQPASAKPMKAEPMLMTEEEKAYIDGMKKAYPRVMSMKEPLTFAEYKRLQKKGYTTEQIKDVLNCMENRATLLKEYVSANRTIQQWLSHRKENKQ